MKECEFSGSCKFFRTEHMICRNDSTAQSYCSIRIKNDNSMESCARAIDGEILKSTFDNNPVSVDTFRTGKPNVGTEIRNGKVFFAGYDIVAMMDYVMKKLNELEKRIR